MFESWHLKNLQHKNLQQKVTTKEDEVSILQNRNCH